MTAQSAERGWHRGGPLAALREAALAFAIYGTLIAIVVAVEKLFQGRPRLWARIAEISVALGIIVFGVALTGGSTGTLIMAAAFWLFVTGALVLLMVLRPDVTT